MNDKVQESTNHSPPDAYVRSVKSPRIFGVHFVRVHTGYRVLWFVQQPSYELERLKVRALVEALDAHFREFPSEYQELSLKELTWTCGYQG